MRAHIVIPEELIEEVDGLVGPRRRSQFFEDAVREKVARTKRIAAAETARGSLSGLAIEGWDSTEEAAAWVRQLRNNDAHRLDPEPPA